MPEIPQAVLWDSDNTIFDTASLHWAKHIHVLKTCGIELPETYKSRIKFNNGAQNWQWLTAELGLSMKQADYLNAIDTYYKDHAGSIEILPHIRETLEYFKALNIPQAVITNGRRNSVMPLHTAKDLTPYFEFYACKEDYEGRKDEGETLLTILQKFKTPPAPQHCLFIDDEPACLKAAQNLGLKTLDANILHKHGYNAD